MEIAIRAYSAVSIPITNGKQRVFRVPCLMSTYVQIHPTAVDADSTEPRQYLKLDRVVTA